MTNQSILLKSLRSVAVIIIIQAIILLLIFITKESLLELFEIVWDIKLIDYIPFSAVITTIYIAIYIYESNKRNNEISVFRRQNDLLESLYTELDAISNKDKKIKFEEGNLQWFNDTLKIGKPLHSIWSINPSPYLSYLTSNINGKETGSLKRKIVKLNQKIEMINGIVLSGEYNLGIFGKKGTRDEVMFDFVEKTIGEMIDLTEEMKKRLEEDFKIKNSLIDQQHHSNP